MTTMIVMPGTGSDADFCRRAFATAATAADARLVALEPESDLVNGYVRRLDALAAEGDDILVGGVSIGAAIAASWALSRAASHTPGDGRCVGVLAALPPWSGTPVGSVAAASAQITADAIERDGFEATVHQMASTSPAWLATELSRSWRSLFPRGLVAQLRAAAAYTAPTVAELASLAVPLGVAAAPDDPLHPIDVGRSWVEAAPRAALRETPLDDFGPAEHLLGEAALGAWRDALSLDACR